MQHPESRATLYKSDHVCDFLYQFFRSVAILVSNHEISVKEGPVLDQFLAHSMIIQVCAVEYD